MARWRATEPARIEPPAWYRRFDPAAWDEPDGQEEAMISGCRGFVPWPDELHEHHARRRWAEAQHAYRRQHPAFAEQEFEDIVGAEHRAREDERNDCG